MTKAELEAELEKARAEIARLRIEPDDVERPLGIDPNDPMEKLCKEWIKDRLRAEAAEAALTEAHEAWECVKREWRTAQNVNWLRIEIRAKWPALAIALEDWRSSPERPCPSCGRLPNYTIGHPSTGGCVVPLAQVDTK